LGSVGDVESSIAEDPRTYSNAPAEQIAWLALTGDFTNYPQNHYDQGSTGVMAILQQLCITA